MPTICGYNLLMAGFKTKGAFWSEFSTQCGKLSPTQSTEELGCWTDCFPAFFFCRETGANALFFCSEYYKFQVRESSLCSQISLVQSICLLHECCRALLPSFPQLLPFAPFSSRLRVIFNWRANKEMDLGSTVSANDLFWWDRKKPQIPYVGTFRSLEPSW